MHMLIRISPALDKEKHLGLGLGREAKVLSDHALVMVNSERYPFCTY